MEAAVANVTAESDTAFRLLLQAMDMYETGHAGITTMKTHKGHVGLSNKSVPVSKLDR